MGSNYKALMAYEVDLVFCIVLIFSSFGVKTTSGVVCSSGVHFGGKTASG